MVGAAAISSGHLSLPIIGRIFRGASSEENFTKGTRTNQHEHSAVAAVENGNYKMELMNTSNHLTLRLLIVHEEYVQFLGASADLRVDVDHI